MDTSESISVDEIKAVALSRMGLSTLAMLSAALASFLDPLEAVTRYPDTQQASFDENTPYIKNFMGLYGVIARILKKTGELTRSQLHINAGR